MALACPEDTNYAAIAKQMHLTALEAEQRIFSLEHLLRSAANRPTIVQVSTSAITGIPVNTDWRIGTTGGANFATLFNNTPMDVADDDNFFTTIGEGIYEVGMFANMIASGAVTNNSSRYFTIAHTRPDPAVPGNTVRITEATQHLFEPSAGVGVDCCVSLTFRALRSDSVEFEVFHNNVGSDINVPAGTLVYITKLSDATVVTVV
jgi:hypothetical protein